MKKKIYHFKTLSSTNLWVKDHLDLFDADTLALIFADEQTAGSGRLGRKWFSPVGKNLYATFHLCLDKGRKDVAHVTQVLALSLLKLLVGKGFKPSIKWPNDVWLGDKKLAGILTEVVQEGGYQHVIIGIGVNINMPLEFLQYIGSPATSLLVASGKEWSIVEIMEELYQQFYDDLLVFLDRGITPFLKVLRENTAWLNELVTFDDDKCIWHGRFTSWNDDGSVTLSLEDGSEKTFWSGQMRKEAIN